WLSVCLCPVHPHVRGAWDGADLFGSIPDGPSPRAWGLAPDTSGVSGDTRSIPTCVGLGDGAPDGAGGGSVHPHVRGAWNTNAPDAPTLVGPSPRAWGLGIGSGGCTPWWRSIPTCVGLGFTIPVEVVFSSVHPHVRGAWASICSVLLWFDGPSPRAWGLEYDPRPAGLVERSIPTCVGLGSKPGRSTAPTAVHPHVRGAWTSRPAQTFAVTDLQPNTSRRPARPWQRHHYP